MPVLSYVKPFTFTTQEGLPFTQQDLNGKVTVVEYFFTTCKGICPKMNNNMKGIYETFLTEPNFQILSHPFLNHHIFENESFLLYLPKQKTRAKCY